LIVQLKGTEKPMTENARIVIDPEICYGSPCVRGLRNPVKMILELLASGMLHSEILADYADLEEDDIRACLQYAARLRNSTAPSIMIGYLIHETHRSIHRPACCFICSTIQ
jgi:uncharacterized protein (DUF433 family)